MTAQPRRELLDALDRETARVGGGWVIGWTAAFYCGAADALEDILGGGPLCREAREIADALFRLGERAADLETAAAQALAKGQS